MASKKFAKHLIFEQTINVSYIKNFSIEVKIVAKLLRILYELQMKWLRNSKLLMTSGYSIHSNIYSL